MKKVLVVDDEPRILKFLSLKLSSSGFDVTAAENGSAALEITRKNPPDIILMDIIMPGMDGVETLKKLRTYCSCPVILFSARDHDQQEIRALGADDYIRKPFDPEEIITRINHFLNGRN
jgi:two-component system, OmpR family, KDP operon response regulator KdpE